MNNIFCTRLTQFLLDLLSSLFPPPSLQVVQVLGCIRRPPGGVQQSRGHQGPHPEGPPGGGEGRLPGGSAVIQGGRWGIAFLLYIGRFFQTVPNPFGRYSTLTHIGRFSSSVKPFWIPFGCIFMKLVHACSGRLVCQWMFLYPCQAMSCESWADGDPTQVEEDLWDDSLLAVSLPIEMFCMYSMLRTN